MAFRASRNLTLSFGLVNVQVKWQPLVSDGEKISGSLRCREHHLPVKQFYLCEGGDGHYITKADCDTGYPYEDGCVIIPDGDIKSLEVEHKRTIELTAAPPVDTIDPMYFERTYALKPEKGHEAGYDILRAALADTGRVLVGLVVVSKSTVALLVRELDGLLVAHTCYHGARLRTAVIEELRQEGLQRPSRSPQEVELAKMVLESLPGEFDPQAVVDDFAGALREEIERRGSGQVRTAEVEKKRPEPVPDIMAALRESVAEIETRKKVLA